MAVATFGVNTVRYVDLTMEVWVERRAMKPVVIKKVWRKRAETKWYSVCILAQC